ncbi:hypothetical protein T01_8702 [Trichinella spiralis]|uniref:Uncharacterized protein n=1 Tax=Trichinella spiralis TaxID=6334 RepID=A0A0V1AKU6_TRISP|nr:hypothetical protein T01_1715 [Trichinella spiralis]KRY25432.1 hypothetical protein T01_13652 [Trichinella spiralis]KRY25991.1 hypothetical protein T01_8702 [Trichinella spiralis]
MDSIYSNLQWYPPVCTVKNEKTDILHENSFLM